nr:amidase family protein [Variovorax terrae]
MTAQAVRAALQAGQFSAQVYGEALLARCAAFGTLNALAWLEPEAVLRQARDADRARAAGEPVGSLAGLPVVVKDNIDTPGFPTSAGNAWLRSCLPDTAAPVWQALAGQGAILLGKANMHELAAGGTSNNPVFGRVGNPVSPGRIAGGSSGGTAAAIAAGLAPLGLGTDTSGSLRTPASFCGIAALRPTTAGERAYSAQGIVPLVAALDTAGPMARSVADLVLLHGAITARSPSMPPAPEGLRLGVPRSYFWDRLQAPVDQLCRMALGRLQDAGIACIELDLGELAEEAVHWQIELGRAGRLRDLRAFLAQRLPGVDLREFIGAIRSEDVRALYLDSPASAQAEAPILREHLPRLRRRYQHLLDTHCLDAIAYPCVPVAAPLEAQARGRPDDVIELHGQSVALGLALARNARFAAALGAPALVLPAGRSEEGLAIGLELAARLGDDGRLLALGQTVEAVLASHRQKTPKFE